MDDYSSGSAALRLRRLQSLVSELGLDAICFVAGQDGKFNLGSSQGIAFSLFGKSGRGAIEGAGLGSAAAAAALQDAILVIRPGFVSAYVPTGAAADYLMELLSGHIEVQLFVPTAEEAADPDLADEVKVASMVQMLRGTKKLGIPLEVPAEGAAPAQYVPGSSPAKLDTSKFMQLEQWPLIMAYGMESVGRSGFFTQNYEVYDVYAALQAAYAVVDGHGISHAVHDSVKNLKQHWTEMIKGVTSQPASQRSAMTERQVLEPLQGFFQYGMLRAVPGVSRAVTMQPRAVFGVRSNDESAQAESHTLVSAAQPGLGADLAAPGTCGSHLVVEGADPCSALRAARTYFWSTADVTRDVFADGDEEAEEGFSFQAATQGWDPSHTITLMRVYTALVQAAQAGMEHFALKGGATAHTARGVVADVLSARCSALGVPQPDPDQQLRVALWQCDHANRVQGVATQQSRQLKVLRVSLLDVRGKPSRPDAQGPLLGGLVYADTFMEVPAHIGKPASLLVLTAGVPALVAWPAVGCEAVLQQRITHSFTAWLADAAAGRIGSATLTRAGQNVKQQQAALEALKRSKKSSKGGAGVADEDQPHDQDDADGARDTEDGHVSDDDEARDAKLTAHWPGGGGRQEVLGPLLTQGGSDEVVLLTGAVCCPAEVGSLYCFSHGLVFINQHTKALWVLNFHDELESVTIQSLMCDPETGAGGSVIGEAVVLRGRRPACGLAPAAHMTTNTHLAISLASMTADTRRHMLSVVLPAWQQTCREGAPTPPGAPASEPSRVITYLKDYHAANPFPAPCHLQQLATVQVQHEAGKAWRDLVTPDARVNTLLGQLDAHELSQLCPAWPSVESLLLQTGVQPSSSVPITLILGLPGADQASVAQSVVDMIGEAAAPRVVCLTTGTASASLSSLTAEWQAALQSGLASNSLCRHLVVISSGFTRLVDQLTCLAGTAAVQDNRCHLSGVLVAVNPGLLWEDHQRSKLMPGLVGQLPAGFVDAVAVSACGAAEYKQAHATLVSLVPAACPPIIRGGSKALLMKAQDDLLPQRQERVNRVAAQAPQRHWYYWPPAAAAGVDKSSCVAGSQAPPLRAPLQSVHLSFTGDLDLAKLKDALEVASSRLPALQLTEAPPPATGTCQGPPRLTASDSFSRQARQAATALQAGGAMVLGAWGVVRPGLGLPAQEVVWRHKGATAGWELSVLNTPMMDLPAVHGCPAVLRSDVTSGGELLVWGTSMQPGLLQSLLEGCTPAPGPVQAAIQGTCSRASLSAADIARIAEAHKQYPLPEGYTFDGDRFYDAFGDASPMHPCLDDFITQYISDTNQQALQHNQEAQAATDAALAKGAKVSVLQSAVHSV